MFSSTRNHRGKRVKSGDKMVSMLSYEGVDPLFMDYIKVDTSVGSDEPSMLSLVTRMTKSGRPHKVTIIVEEVQKVVTKKTVKAITATG